MEDRDLFHRRRFDPGRGYFSRIDSIHGGKAFGRGFSICGTSISGAVAFTAALFGVVHLEVGAVVVLGAVMLGLVVGELRRRSGSLLPAIIVYALFNCADAIWH